MLNINPVLHKHRAVLEFSQEGPQPMMIELILVSRSGPFSTTRANNVLLRPRINLPPGERKYLDLTDALNKLSGEGASVDRLVWLTFIPEENPTGQPPPACFAVAMQDGKVTRFESFTFTRS
jgi:hypothetical protein